MPIPEYSYRWDLVLQSIRRTDTGCVYCIHILPQKCWGIVINFVWVQTLGALIQGSRGSTDQYQKHVLESLSRSLKNGTWFGSHRQLVTTARSTRQSSHMHLVNKWAHNKAVKCNYLLIGEVLPETVLTTNGVITASEHITKCKQCCAVSGVTLV